MGGMGTMKYLAEGYVYENQVEWASSVMMTAKVWFGIITGADVGSDWFLKMWYRHAGCVLTVSSQ
jgi:hypothetical protein